MGKPSAFADALATTKPSRGGAPSLLEQIRSAMPDKDRAAFDAALVDPSVTARQIRVALKALGFEVRSESTVAEWRRRARG